MTPVERVSLEGERRALEDELGLYAVTPFPVMMDAVERRRTYCKERIAEIDEKLSDG